MFSSELIQEQLKRAAAGKPLNWTVNLQPFLSRPRIDDPARTSALSAMTAGTVAT